jgi:hypothetical protein
MPGPRVRRVSVGPVAVGDHGMPTFTIRSTERGWEAAAGTIEASNSEEAIQRIRNQQLFPTT